MYSLCQFQLDASRQPKAVCSPFVLFSWHKTSMNKHGLYQLRRALLSCFGLFVGVSDMGPAVRLDQIEYRVDRRHVRQCRGWDSSGNGATGSDGE